MDGGEIFHKNAWCMTCTYAYISIV
uniref:Uncharacterized protein n=1 Tax=Tarenaya spinosa TaxID=228870 RepID=Q1KUN1_9ROSI|nr:hypothetical protein [Tarenaya spinosa]